mgnify:CR=1 FL=1
MVEPERARILLQTADQDIHLLKAHVRDEKLGDEMWGFHAQQAVEKLLKAMLAHRDIEYPFTHRLALLMELIQEAAWNFRGG